MNIDLFTTELFFQVTTHQELSKDSFLSNLACLIPMPDCNQSPRNMYQCQVTYCINRLQLNTWKGY